MWLGFGPLPRKNRCALLRLADDFARNSSAWHETACKTVDLRRSFKIANRAVQRPDPRQYANWMQLARVQANPCELRQRSPRRFRIIDCCWRARAKESGSIPISLMTGCQVEMITTSAVPPRS